jgi:hypothetical protein
MRKKKEKRYSKTDYPIHKILSEEGKNILGTQHRCKVPHGILPTPRSLTTGSAGSEVLSKLMHRTQRLRGFFIFISSTGV